MIDIKVRGGFELDSERSEESFQGDLFLFLV